MNEVSVDDLECSQKQKKNIVNNAFKIWNCFSTPTVFLLCYVSLDPLMLYPCFEIICQSWLEMLCNRVPSFYSLKQVCHLGWGLRLAFLEVRHPCTIYPRSKASDIIVCLSTSTTDKLFKLSKIKLISFWKVWNLGNLGRGVRLVFWESQSSL